MNRAGCTGSCPGIRTGRYTQATSPCNDLISRRRMRKSPLRFLGIYRHSISHSIIWGRTGLRLTLSRGYLCLFYEMPCPCFESFISHSVWHISLQTEPENRSLRTSFQAKRGCNGFVERREKKGSYGVRCHTGKQVGATMERV